ncbi:MAG TPA: hypothetical protein VLV46_07520 [Gaiellaceae bacterium]|nr:hypothetical protein [Gaiellaceae bacterium]
MAVVLVLLLLVGIAALCGYIAERKNRSFIGWAVAGLFFHLLAALVIALLPAKTDDAPV